MSPSFRSSLLLMLLLSLAPFRLAAGSSEEDAQKAWEYAATFRSNEAYTKFSEALGKKEGDQREYTLGQATALIGVQPKTASNIDKASRLCQKLITENSGDQVGLLASYLLARIEQYHRQPANPGKAEEIYRKLLQEHPESLVAQIAASKLAVLVLFTPGTTPGQKEKGLAEIESFLPKMTVPEARSNTLVVMGNACIMFHLGDEKALRYLVDAEAAQISSVKLRGDVLIQIGTTAQRLKRKDVALQYYTKFVEGYKRDTRNYLVRQKMAELNSGS